MTYYQQLHPWCIIRLLPKMQQQIVARFRRRNDAEAHLQALRQLDQYRITKSSSIQPFNLWRSSMSELSPLQRP